MDRHSVGRCAPAEAASGAEIKCLVFLAGGQPLLVVLRLEDRVSQPLLARHLGLPKSRLKLAPLDRLVALCGWPVGSVPPFAHRPALRTLVDAQVAQHSHVVFGDDRQHVVPAAELLRASAAAVAAVSTAGGVAGAGPPAEQPRLPLPWAEGAQAATMIGIVAQKRKIARLLVFASLVPVQPGPLPTVS
jgi:prolyl-tRNA editing enzyme YbaK/EbsC (Cys-tRNA(Pro) deacylase)